MAGAIGFRKFVCGFYLEESLINHVLVVLKGDIEYLKILYKRNVILKYKQIASDCRYR